MRAAQSPSLETTRAVQSALRAGLPASTAYLLSRLGRFAVVLLIGAPLPVGPASWSCELVGGEWSGRAGPGPLSRPRCDQVAVRSAGQLPCRLVHFWDHHSLPETVMTHLPAQIGYLPANRRLGNNSGDTRDVRHELA